MDGGGVDVAVPGSADGTGEFERLDRGLLGRVEPIGAELVELACDFGD